MIGAVKDWTCGRFCRLNDAVAHNFGHGAQNNFGFGARVSAQGYNGAGGGAQGYNGAGGNGQGYNN